MSSLLLASQAASQDYGSGAPHAGGINWGPVAAGGEAAADWSESFVAWWDLEEASGARVATGGSCATAGSDCDLTDNNTVTQDTTNYVEGSAAAYFVDANTEYLSCIAATCNELDIANNISFGCWARVTIDDTTRIFFKRSLSSNSGYYMDRLTTPVIRISIGDGTDIQTKTSNSACALDTWCHAVGTFSDTANEINAYVDGAVSGTASTQEDLAASGIDFNISNFHTTQGFDGQLDECFVIADVLTAAEVCRICSCQINGKLCMCDASTPANYKFCSVDADCQVSGNTTALCNGGTCVGRNSTETPNCGSCTLPDCNAAAP